MRLDKYMAEYWPEHSRSSWQKYIEMGMVLVNGTVTTSSSLELDEDDHVTVATLPIAVESTLTLPVVYEDDRVVVINKPSGILTHAKGGLVTEQTVADFIKPRMKELDDTNRPGIVHRLDRDTSGILIATKDSETKRLLQKQFQDRKVKKTYIAILRGTPSRPEANIDLPLARNPKKPSSFRVDPKGKSAQTHYVVLGSNHTYSVVRLTPKTGRTHQLRVHMAHLGTPIAGDDLYGGGKNPISRLCLHAEQLEITIPTSRRETFVAALPDNFQERVDAICG